MTNADRSAILPDVMKNIRTVISIIAVLIICGPSFASSSQTSSVPARSSPPAIPVEITENSTALLFFFWGYLSAEDTINFVDGMSHHSFRDMAAIARSLADRLFGNLPAMAYALGRAYAFDREADRRGEP